MEHFAPAVQLGLTATPLRRDENRDTYAWFGRPVYTYSLREGIEDGYLTPFKVRQYRKTLDDYVYTSDDTVLSGAVQEGNQRSEEHTSELQSLMHSSYAVLCLKTKKT